MLVLYIYLLIVHLIIANCTSNRYEDIPNNDESNLL